MKEDNMSTGGDANILLSRHFNYVLATGAFVIPTSIYFILKRDCIKSENEPGVYPKTQKTKF
ncbi:DnaJ subfamily C member 11 [Gossypium australe]|uniref:DnaJ subfamily C member 11 n=1 Tax=Gossypium australe TaxID=47621 RepID=A0A5B6VJ31_9ROSI|nr:DnaJ subfamily C member 11 [Gossypium australe]